MTGHDGEPEKSEKLVTLTELVCKSASAPTPLQMSRGLHAVKGLLVPGGLRRSALLRVSLAGVLLAVGAAGVWAIGTFARSRRMQAAPSPLTYLAEGGTVIEGGYLRESGNEGIKLSFSEGTTFAMMPGAHGRLRSVDSTGARIAIEDGTAAFQVTPRSGARWLVEAGPFLVTVNGTVFTVSWDVSRERFELGLRHGRVTVSGPVSGGDIMLRAGQRLVVDLRGAETVITEDRPGGGLNESGAAAPAAPAADLPGERPAVQVRRPGRRGDAGSPSTPVAGKTMAQSRWADAVAAGDWDRILREAELTGVESVLTKGASEELFALADAARYRRHMPLAREALLAQRRRFPSSARSLEVPYLLGRVQESSELGMAEALAWYDEYLARAPSGTYASEALGRKMILTGKLEGRAQARDLAEEYLRRFPNGAYAGSAWALRRGP